MEHKTAPQNRRIQTFEDRHLIGIGEALHHPGRVGLGGRAGRVDLRLCYVFRSTADLQVDQKRADSDLVRRANRSPLRDLFAVFFDAVAAAQVFDPRLAVDQLEGRMAARDLLVVDPDVRRVIAAHH